MRLTLIIFLSIIILADCNSGDNENPAGLITETKVMERINELNSLSRKYTILWKTDSAFIFAKKALDESLRMEYSAGVAESYISLCFFAKYYDYNRLNEYISKLNEISQRTGYSKGMAYCDFYRAEILSDISQVRAFSCLEKARHILEKNELSADLAIVLGREGELFANRSDFTEALKYYVLALKQFDKKSSNMNNIYYRYHYSMLLNTIGIAYKNMKDYSKSMDYYKLYLQESERLGEMWGVAIACNNMGNLEMSMGHPKKALNYYERTKKVWDSLGVDNYNGDLYLNLGNVYIDQKNFSLASDCLDSSLAIYKRKKSPTDIAKAISCRGDLFAAKKKFGNAIQEYNLSIATDSIAKNLQLYVENYRGLAASYDSLDKFEKAYYYFKLYSAARDSLFNSEKAKEAGLLTANYEIQKQIEEEKRKAELAAIREKEETNRRNTIQYTGITIFVAVLFTLLFLIGKYRISDTVLEVLVFVSLLLLFEFIQVIFDPLINRITGSEPFYLLLANLAIVGAIIPLDAYLERMMNNRIKKRGR